MVKTFLFWYVLMVPWIPVNGELDVSFFLTKSQCLLVKSHRFMIHHYVWTGHLFSVGLWNQLQPDPKKMFDFKSLNFLYVDVQIS